jgi:hypothetical protein
MCGHAMIDPNLIKAMAEEVVKGKKTAEADAEELARHCGCGIFDPCRAAKPLKKLAAV